MVLVSVYSNWGESRGRDGQAWNGVVDKRWLGAGGEASLTSSQLHQATASWASFPLISISHNHYLNSVYSHLGWKVTEER